MNAHAEAFQNAYNMQFAQIALPAELAEAYQVVSCLRETADKATYQVRSLHDDSKYILKIARSGGRESLASEFALLSALSHPCIPRAKAFVEEGDRQYLVRDYIEGVPLDQFVAESGTLSEEAAIKMMSQFCDILQVLHNQQPPIIHRDIKPQNVLFTPQGDCALIDFGIARRYDKAADEDTVYMGTRATAAPEQFGYMQTDPRSDLYSAGILLLFLLTGSCEIKHITDIPNKALCRVIRRCIRFDPVNRFPSALRMRLALQSVLHVRRRIVITVFFVVCFTAALASLFLFVNPNGLSLIKQNTKAAGANVTSVSAYASPNAAYTFASSQIEQAVREQLNLEADAAVTQADLDRITGLYIIGDTIFNSWSEHSVSGTGDFLNGAPISSVGTINTLEDIAHMPNITELALYNQQIVDLSPLKGLRLTRLGLGGNQISDISILPECGELAELELQHNPLIDIGPLSEISSLTSLELMQTKVRDIQPLAGLSLTYCSLMDTSVLDYSPLLELPHLEWLRLSDLPADQIQVIARLTRLKDLTLYRCGITSLQQIENLADLRFLDLLDNQLTSIDGIEKFRYLNGICLQGNPVPDLSALVELQNLTYINLIGVPANDYSFLSNLPLLSSIYCDADQYDFIMTALNGIEVLVNVV